MEAYLNGSEKQTAVIQDYKEYHTDVTVKFIVQVNATISHALPEKNWSI